jgi:hypothetical protein
LDEKLLIHPSAAKARVFFDNTRAFMRGSSGMTFKVFLKKLNSKLRGWAFVDRRVVAERLFGSTASLAGR